MWLTQPGRNLGGSEDGMDPTFTENLVGESKISSVDEVEECEEGLESAQDSDLHESSVGGNRKEEIQINTSIFWDAIKWYKESHTKRHRSNHYIIIFLE